MENNPKCIKCGRPIGCDSYLGFCSDCAVLHSNPITHTIIGVIAGIIGVIVYRKMFISDGYEYRITEILMGGATFLLMAFGWCFMTSLGLSADNIVLILLKFAASPFVGLVGFPVIIFRLIQYVNREKPHRDNSSNYHPSQNNPHTAINSGSTWTCPRCGTENLLTKRTCKDCGCDK